MDNQSQSHSYTTGEIAAKCGVTVRTVQFYDQKELLHPSDFSEGGRRLYTDDDVSRLRLICLLKSTGLSIDVIKNILEAKNARKVLTVYLGEQLKQVQAEKEKLAEMEENITSLREFVELSKFFQIDGSEGIAIYMEGKKSLKKLYRMMLGIGITADVLEVAGIVVWITTGNWIPAVVCIAVCVPLKLWASRVYAKSVRYICPECNAVFKPKFGEMFWANHTPKTRKLTCPKCGEKSWCIETGETES